MYYRSTYSKLGNHSRRRKFSQGNLALPCFRSLPLFVCHVLTARTSTVPSHTAEQHQPTTHATMPRHVKDVEQSLMGQPGSAAAGGQSPQAPTPAPGEIASAGYEQPPSIVLGEQQEQQICDLIEDTPWLDWPLTVFGFKRGSGDDADGADGDQQRLATRVWRWLSGLHWWSRLLLSVQVVNVIYSVGAEVAAIAGELDSHNVDTYDLSADDIPFALDIDTAEWQECCTPGGGGSAASDTHCIVPTCLPLFAEHPGWRSDWIVNKAQASDTPVVSLATKPEDYTVTLKGWQCDQDRQDWMKMEELGLAFHHDTKYLPCSVYVTGPDHPHGLLPIQVPQLCAPASYCAVVRTENERKDGTVLAFVLGIVLMVLLAINRFYVLRLITGGLHKKNGLNAAGQGMASMSGIPSAQGMMPALHIAKIKVEVMEVTVKEEVRESARRDFIRLWIALPVLVFSYALFWFAAISDPLDRGFWQFTSEHIQEEMPTLSHVAVWLAIPMYLCLFLLPYTSVGATAILLRAACIAHKEHARTITKVLCEQEPAQRSVDSAVNEFRILAEALAGTSKAWKGILTVQVGIFATIILISVGGYVATGHVSLEHTLRAIAMCWPLSFNFWTILSVNGVISDIPKDLTQKRHGEEVFDAAQRCIFAQEFARLDLVIKGPGFGGGVELTSGRMWAGAASAVAVLGWSFIKTLMSWS